MLRESCKRKECLKCHIKMSLPKSKQKSIPLTAWNRFIVIFVYILLSCWNFGEFDYVCLKFEMLKNPQSSCFQNSQSVVESRMTHISPLLIVYKDECQLYDTVCRVRDVVAVAMQ